LLEGPDTDPEKVSAEGQDQQPPKKSLFVDIAGGKQDKGGSIHVVLRVESSEPTDGAARLMNHLTQTQGVFKTFKVD